MIATVTDSINAATSSMLHKTTPTVTQHGSRTGARACHPTTAALLKVEKANASTSEETDASRAYPDIQALTGRFGYKFPTFALAWWTAWTTFTIALNVNSLLSRSTVAASSLGAPRLATSGGRLAGVDG